jgi:hypothetical protein
MADADKVGIDLLIVKRFDRSLFDYKTFLAWPYHMDLDFYCSLQSSI